MNCFEWQNRASDYLDGTLIGASKREADQHLDSCTHCHDRHQHFRLILTSLASQPRATLPIPIRKAPLTSHLPRLEMARLGRSRWEQVPWYIRTTVEGSSIVFLILLGISVGPKLRALYERNIERNFSEFAESITQSDASKEAALFNLPLSRGKPGASTTLDGTHSAADPSSDGDEFAGSEADSDPGSEEEPEVEGSGASNETEIRVGSSEIWRFNFKTDSPHEFRSRIVQALTELKVPANTTGLGGVEAPGGIQFDLMLPQALVAPLKRQLQKLAPPTPEGLSGSPVGETFTWYKNKARNPLPSGKTHVVIWLSQM